MAAVAEENVRKYLYEEKASEERRSAMQSKRRRKIGGWRRKYERK
jgi:hypothetical protein